MTRPIKFRAWDGEKLHNWDSTDHKAINEITGTPYPKLFYLPMSWLVGDSNDWVWMQFTGLKDKNGLEIYEGDIIRIILELNAFPNQGVAEVKWDGNGFWIFNDNSQKTWYKSEHVEVIGNIYENPELLK